MVDAFAGGLYPLPQTFTSLAIFTGLAVLVLVAFPYRRIIPVTEIRDLSRQDTFLTFTTARPHHRFAFLQEHEADAKALAQALSTPENAEVGQRETP